MAAAPFTASIKVRYPMAASGESKLVEKYHVLHTPKLKVRGSSSCSRTWRLSCVYQEKMIPH